LNSSNESNLNTLDKYYLYCMRKNMVYIGFNTVHDFMHPLAVLDKRGLLYVLVNVMERA
jgi:hypothetical protein